MRSPKACFRQEVMESRCERLCLGQRFHDGPCAMQWSGAEISGGEQSWTTPSINIQRQFYVLRVSCMLMLVSHVACLIHGLKL